MASPKKEGVRMARFVREDSSTSWVVFDFPASVKEGDTISVIKSDGTLRSVLVQSVKEVNGMRLATVK